LFKISIKAVTMIALCHPKID